MRVRSIRTDQDFKAAIRWIESLWHAEPGTTEAQLVDVLVDLAWAYEERVMLEDARPCPTEH